MSSQTQLSFSNLRLIFSDFFKSYSKSTSQRIKVIDIFCVFCCFVAVISYGYQFLVGNFPMNSMLCSIFAPLGTLIFTGKMNGTIK